MENWRYVHYCDLFSYEHQVAQTFVILQLIMTVFVFINLNRHSQVLYGFPQSRSMIVGFVGSMSMQYERNNKRRNFITLLKFESESVLDGVRYDAIGI